MAEGLFLSGLGALLGIAAGHLLAFAVASGIASLKGLVLPSMFLSPRPADAEFLLLGLGVGMLAGLAPALLAARTDIAGLLARGRA